MEVKELLAHQSFLTQLNAAYEVLEFDMSSLTTGPPLRIESRKRIEALRLQIYECIEEEAAIIDSYVYDTSEIEPLLYMYNLVEKSKLSEDKKQSLEAQCGVML
ncbi:MAG: hypothetical protein GY861_22145 [bacterium]|nr:hypothetical protein [bacterium]